MNYEEALNYLYTHLPMFSRLGQAAIKKDLTNTVKLSAFLGNPHQQLRFVHVGGTNGKGSTSHMLAGILQSAGYKTGLYTSPHLKDFRERIRVNGEMITETFVTGFVDRISPMIETVEPSFFEISVVMALDYFAQEKCDIVVLEVGLGGRLDSTNIITPELSVITNIGWDHMNILGDSLAKIAFEKAGIIKNKVPVVIGETSQETEQVFKDKAAQTNSQIVFADQHLYAADFKYQQHKLVVDIAGRQTDERITYHLDLSGFYQTKNLVTVLESIRMLKLNGWQINDEAVMTALPQIKKLTGLHGRWDVVHEHPLIVLDVAHNEDGIRQLTTQIELTDHRHLHIVIGMVKDKEVERALALLPREASFYFTKAQIPRALPEDQLQEKARVLQLEGDAYTDVHAAMKAALSRAEKHDLILVCGSVFVVGEFRI
jgi:dihydrofolate synthase/folylpolyglutamate synthase